MPDNLRRILIVAKRAGLLAWVATDLDHIVVRLLTVDAHGETVEEDTPVYDMRGLADLLGS